jgi:hypothetical protein
MAKVKKNVLIEGLSGRIGNLVFRQYGDKTVVSSRPRHDPKRQPTPGEAKQRKRIQEAARTAKATLETDDGRAYYQAARLRLGKRSAYHTAIFDFFGEPEILDVQRDADGSLLIQLMDNVGVRKVSAKEAGSEVWDDATALDDEPCNLWRWQGNEAGITEVLIRAEDGMGKIGEWQGMIG